MKGFLFNILIILKFMDFHMLMMKSLKYILVLYPGEYLSICPFLYIRFPLLSWIQSFNLSKNNIPNGWREHIWSIWLWFTRNLDIDSGISSSIAELLLIIAMGKQLPFFHSMNLNSKKLILILKSAVYVKNCQKNWEKNKEKHFNNFIIDS